MTHAPDPHALALSDAETYDDLRAREQESAERADEHAPFKIPPTGGEAVTSVEARGRPDIANGGRGPNRSLMIGRAAGAHLTGQCQDGTSQAPADKEQYPALAHGGRGDLPSPLLRTAEATMVPTHGAPSQARAVDSSPPAPSSAPADAPAGRTPSSSLSVGASAPPCPRCGGEEVVAVGPPDMFGNYETTDCHCAYPKEPS